VAEDSVQGDVVDCLLVGGAFYDEVPDIGEEGEVLEEERVNLQ